MLEQLLESFWEWLNMSPTEYSCRFCDDSIEEYMFPDWARMLHEVRQCIEESRQDMIPLVLEAMAIDHEVEDVLDFLTERASDSYIVDITLCIATNIQPHARWQGAELICRRPTIEGEHVLKQLMGDTNPYVRKRARNAYILLEKKKPQGPVLCDDNKPANDVRPNSG